MMTRLGLASSSVVEWFVLSLKTSLVHCRPKKTWSSKSAHRLSWTRSSVPCLDRQARGRMAKLRTPHTSMSRRFCEAVDCEVRERELGLLVAES
ncbi:hypothetical protein B0H14DRAFT_2933059 [Mycena olivaceomarginata]|nr:hypothetical protein B0H14DRAFT_2933059 [Mycena olivaceomarginata]